MIYVHLGFFLWLLLIPFIHVKERKMKNVNYTQINYQSNQTNYCSKAMRQKKYFRTKNKNNLYYVYTRANYYGFKINLDLL